MNQFDEETLETGDRLTYIMTKEGKEKLQKIITSTDLIHNSRNVWQTIRKISIDPTTPNHVLSHCKPRCTPTTHQQTKAPGTTSI